MIKLLIFIVVIAIPTKVFSEKTWQIVTENYPPILAKTFLITVGYMKSLNQPLKLKALIAKPSLRHGTAP
ncbi:hypothetical protein P4S63_16995 [Pseudoalteromonas sp. B193]